MTTAEPGSRAGALTGSPAGDRAVGPVRLERLVMDRGLHESEAMDMIASQMPADLKRARADYVIENAGTREELAMEVDRVWNEIAGDSVSSLDAAHAG